MAAAQTVVGRRAPCRVPGMNMDGSAYESQRSTAVPLSYRADGMLERFTFQSESDRISLGSTSWDTPLAERPGRFGGAAGGPSARSERLRGAECPLRARAVLCVFLRYPVIF